MTRQMYYQQKRKFISKEKRDDKLGFRILIVFAIFNILHHFLFEYDTLGHDYRYFIYIFLLPTLTGMIIIGYYKREILKSTFITSSGFFIKVFYFFFYLLVGFVFSYFSFGFVAKASWNYFNVKEAENGKNEYVSCEITRLYGGTIRQNPRIGFLFDGSREIMTIDHESYGKYYKSKPEDLEVQLEIRKGIWNYYIIDGFEIKNKR